MYSFHHMLSHSTDCHLLDVVHDILNMQRYVTSVAGQACSFSGKAAKGGSQYLCLNENVWLLRHSYAILSLWYSITGVTDKSRWKTCYEDVWATTGFCDMKNLPRSLSRHARSQNNIQNQNCFKNFWKRNDILLLGTNSGDLYQRSQC